MQPTLKPAQRFLATALLPAALAALLGGCSSIGAKVHNLEELHGPEGRHQRVAVLYGDFHYGLRYGLAGMFGSRRLAVRGKPPKEVEDPLEECLANLLELSEFDPERGRNSAVQVLFFARLAVDDPWSLSREASVRELGLAGRRLGIEHGAPSAPEGPYAGVDQVRAALAELVAAATPLLRGSASEPELRSLRERAAATAGLALDRQGALRVLEATTVLQGSGRETDPGLQPLRELSLDLQRRLVRFALVHALEDAAPREVAGSDPGWPSERVRAEAVRASVHTFGEPALASFLDRLERAPPRLVVLRVFELVRARGLPAAAAGPDEGAHARWTGLIYEFAVDHPDGRVRVAAMRALSKITGGELASLREEDWQEWWARRRGAVGRREAALEGLGTAALRAPPAGLAP